MRFTFHKMQACGNDFLILDYMNSEPPLFYAKEIQWLCDRHYGIGADGFVILQKGEKTHAKWQFFNSDGSNAPMCGNAARCAVSFLQRNYFPEESPITIETAKGVVRGRCLDTRMVELALFKISEDGQEYHHRVLPTGDLNIELYSVNTGVPHAVIEVKDILTYPILDIGRRIQKHEAFGAEGTNVTFFQRVVGNRISATTYERGVEAETLSCGTGVAAAALVYSQVYMQQFPIEVLAPGGDFAVDVSPVSKMLLLIGPADPVFEITLEGMPSNFEQPLPYHDFRRKK